MIVTLTPHVEFAPVPWVEVYLGDTDTFDGGAPAGSGGDSLDGGTPAGGGTVMDLGNPSTVETALPVGAVSMTIRSTAEGRTFTVRGAIGRPAGGLVVNDYEAPFGVPVTYEAVCFDAGGEQVGTVILGTVLLDVAVTVIQQPLDPKLNATVTLLDKTADGVERPGRSELVDVEDSGLPHYVGGGARRGVTAVPLRVWTETLVMADRLQATLGTYTQSQPQMWLVRTPTTRLPRVFFCHVPVLREVDFNVRYGGEDVTFEATVTEIPQPVPGIAAAVLRYSDVEALFATYTAIEAGYSTYSSIQRDSSLIGAADA